MTTLIAPHRLLRRVQRRLRGSLTAFGAEAAYTDGEVEQRLRAVSLSDPRTIAIHAVASQTAVWSGLLSDAAAHELGRAATRLPTVVFWYRRGLGPEEIGRRLTPFGGSWDGERAIRAACQLIARQLNRARPSDMSAGQS